MALDLIAELEQLIDRLADERIAYALCGGLAVAIYGHPRATMDIDLLIVPDDLARALQLARDLGFDIPARKITFGLRTGAPREVHRVSKLDPDTGELVSLDLLVVAPALDEIWRGRGTASWRDRTISIVSRDGLVAMKRLAGRAQDLADIAMLEGTGDDET